MHRPLFLFILLVSLLPLSSSQLTKPQQVDALNGITKAWKLTEWNPNVDPCKDGSKWLNENESFWLNCSKVGNGGWDITGLKVYGLNVAGEMPQELFNLTELTYLNLSHNLLNGSLPGEIANLTNLEKLDLGVNNLSGSISPLSNLTKLTYLGLSGNMLSGVKGSLEFKKLTSLEHLYIDSNQFDGSLELKNLKNLKTLCVMAMHDVLIRVRSFQLGWHLHMVLIESGGVHVRQQSILVTGTCYCIYCWKFNLFDTLKDDPIKPIRTP